MQHIDTKLVAGSLGQPQSVQQDVDTAWLKIMHTKHLREVDDSTVEQVLCFMLGV
jgi:hypothetical protein